MGSVGGYDFNLWGFMENFKKLLPENARQKFSCLINERRQVMRMSLQVGLDASALATRTMASTVAMWRSSCLQSSGLYCGAQSTIQDLPFENSFTFLNQTEL